MSEVYIKEPATKGKAVLQTTHGDLEIEIWATETPKACRNFCQLILEGYYNGTAFHRVIRDFLIQGGDGTGTGDGCESIYGNPFPDEIHPRLKFRYRGMLGVASAGRGTKTNGSQFFIAMGRLPSLDGKHTLFGKVVGQTIYNLVRLNEVEVDKFDVPVDPPRIVRAELVWDPFGDLEPRYKVGVPKKIKEKEEHRRAPVHKKNVLSFGGGSDEEDEEDDDKKPQGNLKVKSAHDVLNDPRLLKDVAYPEEVAEKKRLREGSKRDEDAKASKRPTPATRVAGKVQKPRKESESEEEADFGGSDSDEVQPEKAPKRDKEAQRQETILKLKKEIVGLANGLPAPEPRKQTGSALEAMRRGFRTRAETRVEPKGKEARRIQAEAVVEGLKQYQDRLRTLLPDEPAEEDKEAEPATLASYWEDGNEEEDKDWLATSGLKFHTSGDKAFQIAAQKKARDSLEIFDPIAATGNIEALQAARKRRNDKVVPSMRRQNPIEKW
ncbi:unnamed protein product [Effrenium voratum]|uniref:PPIase cyclophilin-type domain-containing protein n=1 Tax=Effrenium voratum TaxID=2562239 RepID=A0AA36I1J8_9DINO|nr:unnamed protein product [Effrenium voratum]CAJ1378033.1 unnamed protein product [Effrenium voratum]CAJ1425014.1 unnamed protein product [Effrenium voratum]CAJ1447684.1 unnamed protein product [Effrenium voratum]